ncbi:MAG: ABC transporter permease [Alphaproteobacteria bacterium]|nr:ABC transporter permease [Alphaproteobacteria bacterium]
MAEQVVISEPQPPLLVRLLSPILLLRESPVGMVGAGIVVFWLLVAIFGPFIMPFGPNDTVTPLALPGAAAADGTVHWLGADMLGRDLLTRLVYGAWPVLFYAFLATLSAYTVGITMGLLAGYYGGLLDDIISFFANVILSFPVMVMYVVIISQFGPSGINIVLAITFASAPGVMRIVRGLTLDLRTRDYVAAAQTRGEPTFYILLVEILPNARGPLIVDACLRLGYVVITMGTLGFLGLGLPPPDPDWGKMAAEFRTMAMSFPHMTVIPCIAISSLVLGFNLLADGLREISIRD